MFRFAFLILALSMFSQSALSKSCLSSNIIGNYSGKTELLIERKSMIFEFWITIANSDNLEVQVKNTADHKNLISYQVPYKLDSVECLVSFQVILPVSKERLIIGKMKFSPMSEDDLFIWEGILQANNAKWPIFIVQRAPSDRIYWAEHCNIAIIAQVPSDVLYQTCKG
jgi:hypothetical protein